MKEIKLNTLSIVWMVLLVHIMIVGAVSKPAAEMKQSTYRFISVAGR